MSWETDVQKTDEILSSAAGFFDIGEVTGSRRLGGWANKNYLVSATKGEFIFKVVLEHPREDIESEIEYLRYLKAHNFPAPYYLMGKDNSFIFQGADNILVALPKLPGKEPKMTADIASSVGSNLARLHQLPHDSLSQRRHWLRQEYLPEAVHLIQRNLPNEAPRIVQALDSLKGFKYAQLVQSIVHGDIAPENTLFDGDKLIAFLDWEEVGKGPTLLDLSICIINFCFEGNNFKPDIYKSLMEGYQRVRPLTELEKDQMPLAVRYAGLTQSVWRLLQFGLYHPDPEKVGSYKTYWDFELERTTFCPS